MNVDFSGTRFEGDGRQRIDALPCDVLAGTSPLGVNRSAARHTIEVFERQGSTTHSGRGGMVWIVLEWARVRGIKLHVDGSEGKGFYVRRLVP